MSMRCLLVVLCTVLFVGCEQERESPLVPESRSSPGGRLSFTDQPQSVNPFDAVGRFHNDVMRYAIENIDFYEVIDTGTAGYMFADFLVDFDSTDTITVGDIPLLGESADSSINGYLTWRQGTTRLQRISNLNASAAFTNYVMQLLNANDTMSLSAFLHKCDTVAISALANPNLDSVGKAQVLIVTSVAFHSRQIWENYFDNNQQILGSSSGNIFDISPEERKKNVAEQDLEAAAYGAAGGAAAGFAVGSMVGATVGGIMGAAVGAFPGWLVGGMEFAIYGALSGAIEEGISTSLRAGVEESNKKGSTSTPPKTAKAGKVR